MSQNKMKLIYFFLVSAEILYVVVSLSHSKKDKHLSERSNWDEKDSFGKFNDDDSTFSDQENDDEIVKNSMKRSRDTVTPIIPERNPSQVTKEITSSSDKKKNKRIKTVPFKRPKIASTLKLNNKKSKRVLRKLLLQRIKFLKRMKELHKKIEKNKQILETVSSRNVSPEMRKKDLIKYKKLLKQMERMKNKYGGFLNKYNRKPDYDASKNKKWKTRGGKMIYVWRGGKRYRIPYVRKPHSDPFKRKWLCGNGKCKKIKGTSQYKVRKNKYKNLNKQRKFGKTDELLTENVLDSRNKIRIEPPDTSRKYITQNGRNKKFGKKTFIFSPSLKMPERSDKTNSQVSGNSRPSSGKTNLQKSAILEDKVVKNALHKLKKAIQRVLFMIKKKEKTHKKLMGTKVRSKRF